MSKILDAIKELGDNPPHGEVVALALASIADSAERIAIALEKRQSAVTNIYAPDRKVGLPAAGPWVNWHGQIYKPSGIHIDPTSTVRVQFRSKPDHVETYRLDSSEIDWSDVMAYQIVNRSE